MCIGLHVKYPVIVVMKLQFARQFYENNTLILNFMKIRLMGVELLHAEIQTDRQHITKLIVTFRILANAPKGT